MEQKKKIIPIVFMLFMTIFVIGADTFIVSPLVPTISKSFNVTSSDAGLLVTAYSIGYAVFAFVFGPISDRIGRKKLLVGGLFFFSVFCVLCSLSVSFEMLFLCRVLSGVAAAAAAPQVWASIGDLIPLEIRGRVMGIVSAALAVSQMLGVPIGAFIAGAGGWKASFVSLGMCSLVVFVLAITMYPNIGRAKKNDNISVVNQLVKPLKDVLTNRRAFSGLLVTFFLMFGSFGMYSFMGVWLTDSFNLTVTQVGSVIIVVGVGNFIGNLTGGFLADKFGKKKVAIVGMSILAIALILLPHITSTIGIAMALILVWFISGGVSLSSLNSLLVGLVPSLRGTMMSLNSSFMYLGTTIGVAINSVVLGYFGYEAIGLTSGLAAIIATIIISILVSNKNEVVAES